jgi:hypothetical protein
VSDEARVDELRMDVPLLIKLLVHVSRAIDRQPAAGDLLLDVALQALTVRLNVDYRVAGARYGSDEAGFRRWVYHHWPTPPCA